jgi:hypothetical protein
MIREARLQARIGACQTETFHFLRTTSPGTVASVDGRFGQAELMRRRHDRVAPLRSAFAGFRFPPEVIMAAVRRYLRYGLS